MPISQFNEPKLLSNGDLEVCGPFRLEGIPPDDLLGEVTIRFLIVQEVENEAPVLIDGVAGWNGPDGSDWHKIIPAEDVDDRLRRVPDYPAPDDKTGRCRAIGQAIVIRKAVQQPGQDPNDPDPPIFDSFTWCVKTNVVRGG